MLYQLIMCAFFASLQVVFWLQVGVKDLKCIGSQCWAMMREGEAEKQVSIVKSY